MDDVTSRTRAPSRQMASARAGGTTRRSSNPRSSRKAPEPAVSPARWAGVALVIAAIVGAVFLGMISPSDSAAPGQVAVAAEEPTPSPEATMSDVSVPVVQPVITTPLDGQMTPEVEIPVTVDVPADETVPRKYLDLYVYLGSEIYTFAKPKPGTTVTVEGVRLAPGDNVLTAALGSPNGPGPVSEPVVVTLDEDAPKLEITSPQNKYETYDDVVVVSFTSEPGAKVRIRNEASKFNQPDQSVNAGGEGSIPVPLKRGVRNHIVVTSVDQAGLPQEAAVNVTRIDGRATVKLKTPKSIDPPEEVRIVARVTDADGKPMEGVDVHFTLGGPGRDSMAEQRTSKKNGRAAWVVQVPANDSPADELQVGVVVISPATGERTTADRDIPLR